MIAEHKLQVLSDARSPAALQLLGYASAAQRAAGVSRLVPHVLLRLLQPEDHLALGEGDRTPSLRVRLFARQRFGIPPQPPAALSAPPTLETPQKSNLATWRIPELPSDHTSTVPDRILVGTAAPKVNVPAEAIYRLTHATKSRTPCMCGFAVRRGRRAELKGNPLLRSPNRQVQPGGAWLRAASARARRSARIGWAPQYDSMASRGVGGIKGRARARDSTARGNTRGNALVRRTSDRRFPSALSSCQPDMYGPLPAKAS
jgi:hypothetical protein